MNLCFLKMYIIKRFAQINKNVYKKLKNNVFICFIINISFCNATMSHHNCSFERMKEGIGKRKRDERGRKRKEEEEEENYKLTIMSCITFLFTHEEIYNLILEEKEKLEKDIDKLTIELGLTEAFTPEEISALHILWFFRTFDLWY